MDVADLRQRILRALDQARKDAAARRVAQDTAAAEYAEFLAGVAAPLFRQAATILRAEGLDVVVSTPAGSVRLSPGRPGETFLELELETTGDEPQVIGRTSVVRGGHRPTIAEHPIAPGKPIRDLADDDVAKFLIAEVPRVLGRA